MLHYGSTIPFSPRKPFREDDLTKRPSTWPAHYFRSGHSEQVDHDTAYISLYDEGSFHVFVEYWGLPPACPRLVERILRMSCYMGVSQMSFLVHFLNLSGVLPPERCRMMMAAYFDSIIPRDDPPYGIALETPELIDLRVRVRTLESDLRRQGPEMARLAGSVIDLRRDLNVEERIAAIRADTIKERDAEIVLLNKRLEEGNRLLAEARALARGADEAREFANRASVRAFHLDGVIGGQEVKIRVLERQLLEARRLNSGVVSRPSSPLGDAPVAVSVDEEAAIRVVPSPPAADGSSGDVRDAVDVDPLRVCRSPAPDY